MVPDGAEVVATAAVVAAAAVVLINVNAFVNIVTKLVFACCNVVIVNVVEPDNDGLPSLAPPAATAFETTTIATNNETTTKANAT